LLHGNLGYSYVLRRNVSTVIAERIGNTALLALAATLLELLIGAAMALVALKGPRLAKIVDAVNLVMIAAPEFTVALALILLFGFRWHIFPVTGGFGLPQLVLPAFSLALASYPWYTQLIREEATQSLSSSYV